MKKKMTGVLLCCVLISVGSVTANATDGQWNESSIVSESSKNADSVLNGWIEESDGMHYYIEGIEVISQGVEVEGNWYYFNENGISIRNSFRQKGEDRFYYDANGCLVKNAELDINGEHYKFQSSGAAYRGWDETENGRYYYTEDGSRAVNEGVKIDGCWYYFKEDGQILKGWREKDGGYYYYDEAGHLLSSQGIEIEDKWYYLTSSGRRLQSEFRQKGEDRFYYDANGWLVKNLDTMIAGHRYIFQSNGAAYRGLMTENGKVIGFDPYGRQAFNAGVKDSGYWYYFDGTGTMMKNWWRTKDGEKYYYQSDGKLAVNVGLKIDGYWYYFTSSGKMHTGWRDKGNDRYYYDSNGHLVKNCTMLIDGVQYEFDSAGRVKNYPRCIAVFSTVSTNTYNGTYNMTKALLSFNQVVIQPGQTLSFFAVAGPCGAAEGYLPAGVVGGVGYGGGICQASTTLYGAALRAGLTIVERSNHSVPSTYVPIGQDAMVNYGTNDLKIRNDYNYPVKIVTYVYGNTLYAEVWGIQPSWYDHIQINSWWTGSNTAIAYREYIKNGVVVKTEQLPGSYYY